MPDSVLINVQCENNDPLSVRLGICLPAGCSVSETKELVKCNILYHLFELINIKK